jgi:hypothetical protein
MEEAFRAVLTSASSVTALVPASRINWGSHPQGAGLPGVVLTVVSGAEGLHLTGRDGLSQGRVQVDCYGATYTSAKAVARAVTTRLHGYSASSLRLVQHVATRDGREGGSNEAERPFRVSLDFETHWRA